MERLPELETLIGRNQECFYKIGQALKEIRDNRYKKTGIIPAPLLLVEKGVMEGRKCSGRPRAIDEQTQRRFIEMVKASCDPSSQRFIFITRRARTIKNYHHWLEEELGKTISLPALRRCVKRENLKFDLEKEDEQDQSPVAHAFKSVPVFSLIQVDGCRFQYLKIRNEQGNWQKGLEEVEVDRNGKSGGFKTGMKEDGNYMANYKYYEKSIVYGLVEGRSCNDDKLHVPLGTPPISRKGCTFKSAALFCVFWAEPSESRPKSSRFTHFQPHWLGRLK